MRAGVRRVLVVAWLGLGLAGCGGGGDSGDKSATEAQRPSAGSGNAQAKSLFRERCGGCHTLTAAGTTGTRGVNFDFRKVGRDDALFAIRNGGFGGQVMPKDIVTGADAEDVARYLAQTSGSKADGDLDSRDVRRLTASPAGEAAGSVAAPSAGISRTFLRRAFDSAQDLWRQKFAAADLHYRPAHLVFFDAAVSSPCGHQTAQTGPFYCPLDHGVYLNTAFFDALGRQFGLDSPFAPGYVTAHEVGHHVQQLLGLHHRVAVADAQDPGGANPRSIRVELQADCYAGIWLHFVARAGQITQADITDILRAATVVGDDFQRNRAGAELAPETWTHGSSEQRVHWLTAGKESGLPADCDTFATG
jgi:predicted metalloprotease